MRTALAGMTIALALGPVLSPAPAQARTPSDLGITVPGSADLGNGTAGQTLSGSLGPVTVTDSAGLVRTMTVTVTLSGAFTVTQAGQSWTLPSNRVAYWSGPVTTSSNLGVCTTYQQSAAAAVDLSSPRTAFACLTIAGLSPSFTWNPRLVISTPATIPAGTFTGTITHSVA